MVVSSEFLSDLRMIGVRTEDLTSSIVTAALLYKTPLRSENYNNKI